MNFALALSPLVIAMFWLVGLQRPAREAGIFAACATVVLILLVPSFRLSLGAFASSLSSSLSDLLLVSVLLLPALWFYQIQKASGVLAFLFSRLTELFPDRELQMLFLVFGVGTALEATCGWGIGALLALPFLARLYPGALSGKVRIVILGLFSQLLAPWAAFGSGTIAASLLMDYSAPALGSYTAFLLFPIALGLTLLALQLSGGLSALQRHFLPATLTALVFVGGLWLCCRVLNVDLAGIGASLLVCTLLALWMRVHRALPVARPSVWVPRDTSLLAPARWKVVLPFLVFFLLLLGTHGFSSVNAWFQQHEAIVLAWSVFSLRLPVLFTPAWALLGASLTTLLLFPRAASEIRQTLRQAWQPYSGAVLVFGCFTLTATLIQQSGLGVVLSNSLALDAMSSVWMIPVRGLVNGWLSGNLFAGNGAMVLPLQTAATMNDGWMLASQMLAASIASWFAPTRLVLMILVIGVPLGEEGKILRRLGPVWIWTAALLLSLLLWFLSENIFALLALPFIFSLLFLSNSFGLGARQIDLSDIPVQEIDHAFSEGPLPSHRGASSPHLRILAFGALVLVYVLYATFSLVAEPTLWHIDPVIFVAFQSLLLLPFAGLMLSRNRQLLTQPLLIRGSVVGGMLGIGFICIALSVRASGITDTAAFMCLDGIVATFISFVIFRQRIQALTWIACACLFLGSLCLWIVSSFHWQADLLAATGGSLFTVCAFLIERWGIASNEEYPNQIWPVLGIQFLVMTCVTFGLALCFGRWSSVQTFTRIDVAVLVYTSIGTVLLPVALTIWMQRYVTALSIAFLAVLEPMLSVAFAYFLMHEHLPTVAYLGMAIMLIGILLQAASNASPQDGQLAIQEITSETAPETDFLPAAQQLLSWDEIRRRRMRMVLAYVAAAPQGIHIGDLQLATGWSEAQINLALAELQEQKCVVAEANTQCYILAPDCRVSGAMLWYA